MTQLADDQMIQTLLKEIKLLNEVVLDLTIRVKALESKQPKSGSDR
jgi:hypothetical protein